VRCGNRAEVVVPNVPMIVVAGCLVVGCLVVVRWLLCAGHLMHFAFIYGHWMRVTQRFPSRCLMFWPRQVSGLFTRKPEKPGNPKIQKTKIYPQCEKIFIGHRTQIFHTFTKGQIFLAPHFPFSLLFCDFCLYEWIVFSGDHRVHKRYGGCSFIFSYLLT